MTDTAQLARETEQTRAELEGTLDELRARITPGQIVDQLMERARDGRGGEFVRNFGQQIAANPIPVAVMGIGLAWLMMANRNPQPRSRTAHDASVDDMYSDRGMDENYVEPGNLSGEFHAGDGSGYRIGADGSSRSLYDDASDYDDGAEDGSGSRLREMAQDATGRIRNSAHAARDSIGDTAASVRDGLQHGAASARQGMRRARKAIGDSASEAGEMSRRFFDFCREQPLIVAGLGLAIGAAIGAMLPATRMEDELVGDASDEVKRRASGMADRMSSEASSAWREARDSVVGNGSGSSSMGTGEHEESYAAGASGGADLEEDGAGDSFGGVRSQQGSGGAPAQHRIVE